MIRSLFVVLMIAGELVLQPELALRRDLESWNAAMVDALKRDAASVAGFYTDVAAVIGGGQRLQGRAAIDSYWRGATGFSDWRLEVIAAGGPSHAPWQYGRSVLTSRSGRTMETYFLGLLRRQPGGELKFQVDAFVREAGKGGEAEAEAVTKAWLSATESGNADALLRIFDDAYVLVSATGARTKSEEIANLVPQSGVALPYFTSDDTMTQGFGNLAVTTGVLKWRVRAGAPESRRHYVSIAVRRQDGWKILAQQVTPV